MRIIHLADLHFLRDRYDEAAASIQAARDDGKTNGVDLFAIAGDVWDGPVQNTAGARFADFLELIKGLADIAPVAMIYGTPSHDTEGSLEVFEQITSRYGVHILRPGVAYYYDARGITAIPTATSEAIIFGVPEPNKKWLLANAGAIGKDEADEAVRIAMRNLFLGLGGMRKEHAGLPCLLLYHGQVAGARSATGFGVERGSGLAVTRDDLAAVNADYIALGDIHEPQQIGDLPAYYPGSIYPKDFGETHKAGANVVDLRPVDVEGGYAFDYTLSRLDFPHPQRVHVYVPLGQQPSAAEIAGKIAWVQYTREGEAGLFDDASPDALLEEALAAGALEGSRVTIDPVVVETVRAGEIAEKKTLREKVQVYADNSSLPASDSVLTKADELEREMAASGQSASGAFIRMDKLVLRGAIGIWMNSRKDEIVLDLEALGAGVLAFASPNGAGKTTILENMHPWPCMLTRDGTLKSHFRLKDSCRDLYFTDERTSWRYRAQITIRADIDSGVTEYWLWWDKNDGAGLVPLPGINGRKEPYEEAINALFGSLEMYLRTAFVTQRATKYAPDLSDATKGQRKALFAELSGIDYLDRYKEHCKAKADEIEETARDLRAVVENAEDVDEELANIATRWLSASVKADLAEKLMAESAEREKTLSAGKDALQVRVSTLEEKAARRSRIAGDISALLEEIKTIEAEVMGFQEAAKGRDAAEEKLHEFEALEAKAGTLKAEKARLEDTDRKAMAAYTAELSAIDAERRQAQEAADTARRALADVERELAVANAQLSAPVTDHCPTCKQLLPADRLEHIQAERAKIQALVEQLGGKAAGARGSVVAAEAKLSGIRTAKRPEPSIYERQAELDDVLEALDWIDAPALRQAIARASEAAVRIEGAQTRIARARMDISQKENETATLDVEIAGLAALRSEYSAKAQEHEAEKAIYADARARFAAAKATIEAEERARLSAQARADRRDEAKGKLKALVPELADWRFLEKACGPDGIQALELDALAPGIAEVANRLLTASDNTGRIEFRTTRMGGKGTRAKQIEDFLVYYIREGGEEQEISTLSGGEGVWIKKALYDAFSVIRARNTGVKFQTMFLDEADGALDPEARMRYLRMIEAAHNEAGRYQTIIVTHSTELQAMVSQTINVADLKGRETMDGEVSA